MNYVFLLSMIATLFVSILGITEYILYNDEDKKKAGVLPKIYLFGMLLLGMFGLIGIGLMTFGLPSSAAWGGYSILFVLITILVIIQYRMHQKMGVAKSPIRKKLSRSSELGSIADEDSNSEDENEEDDGTDESSFDDPDRDVLGYEK